MLYIFVTKAKHINIEVKELLMFPIVVVSKDVDVDCRCIDGCIL